MYEPTVAMWAMDIITDPQLQQVHGPREGPQQKLKPRCHYDPCGCTGHPDQYCTGDSKALRHQHGLRCLSKPWAFVQLLVAIGAMDINPEPGLLGHRPRLDLRPKTGHTLALYGSVGNHCGSVGNRVAVQATQMDMSLVVAWPSDTNMATHCDLDPGGHLYGLWCHHGLQTSTQTLDVVGPQARHGLYQQPVLDITMAQVIEQSK